ncbi:MAG: CHRD domain-containing protein [Dehalococcoidales bacterium]|nr:CHRD domain-containing protein [Dehalococcoidales bacterium]
MTVKKVIFSLVLVTAMLALSAGTTSGMAPGTFTATLTGSGEVPPVTTMASGEATFIPSADGTQLTYTLTVSGTSDIIASHIHLAPAGANGPVVAGLFGGPLTGPFDGVLAQGTITAAELKGPLAGMPLDALVAEIKAGNTYVNVHTSANPPGEIRGQIVTPMP